MIEIRDFLGHASVTTTEIYARVNIEMKHKALLTINEEIGIKEPKVKSWERNPELKSLLKSFAK